MRRSVPALLLAIVASGVPVRTAPLNTCSPVDLIYAILRGPLKAEASSFCLKFLGGDHTTYVTQTKTATAARVTDTTKLPDVISTETDAFTLYATVTDTSVVMPPDATATVTVYQTVATATIYQRGVTVIAASTPVPTGRDAALSLLSKFAASKVSSACSCVVAPALRTLTSTAHQTVTPRTTLTRGPASTVVVTVTATARLTSTVDVTQTLPAVTDTVTATATSGYVVTLPKRCHVVGTVKSSVTAYTSYDLSAYFECVPLCRADRMCKSTGYVPDYEFDLLGDYGTCYLYSDYVANILGPDDPNIAKSVLDDAGCPAEAEPPAYGTL